MNENEKAEFEQQIPSNFDESISFEGLDAKYVELQKQLEELTDKYYRANADYQKAFRKGKNRHRNVCEREIRARSASRDRRA